MDRDKPRYRPEGKPVLPASEATQGENVMVFPATQKAKPFEARVVGIKQTVHGSYIKDRVSNKKVFVEAYRETSLLIIKDRKRLSIGGGTAILRKGLVDTE